MELASGDEFCRRCGHRLPVAAGRVPLAGADGVAPGAQLPATARPTLSTLLPLEAWFSDGRWRRGLSLAFLLFGAAPWVLLRLDLNSTSVVGVAWEFSIYFAFLWAAVLWAVVRPGRLPVRTVVAVVLEAALVGVPLAMVLEEQFLHNGSLTTMIFAVGFPEEFAKALPVFVFLYRSPRRAEWSPRLYLYLGVVSGLTFGAVEAVEYVVDAFGADLYSGQVLTAVVWRLLTDSLFHALTAGIVCYFIGLAARVPQWRLRLIGFGLGLAMLLHGINDRYAGSWTQTAVAIGLLFIFLGYVRDGERIETVLGAAAVRADSKLNISKAELAIIGVLSLLVSAGLLVAATQLAGPATADDGGRILGTTGPLSGTRGADLAPPDDNTTTVVTVQSKVQSKTAKTFCVPSAGAATPPRSSSAA